MKFLINSVTVIFLPNRISPATSYEIGPTVLYLLMQLVDVAQSIICLVGVHNDFSSIVYLLVFVNYSLPVLVVLKQLTKSLKFNKG